VPARKNLESSRHFSMVFREKITFSGIFVKVFSNTLFPHDSGQTGE
jgi:hypothetical protein